MLQFLSPLPSPNTSIFPINEAAQLAANKGLGGNQPTSLAIGPDGAAYFGNLKNNNLLTPIRIRTLSPWALSNRENQSMHSRSTATSSMPVWVTVSTCLVPTQISRSVLATLTIVEYRSC